ncbi:MAG: ABC-F family ATP-binding cassette domain-containing protein [Gemmatimonadota bacterium]
MTQLSLAAVGVHYGASIVLRDVTFTVAAGERWGIIGRNGSGKTSLLRLVAGEQEPSAGQVSRQPGLRVAVLDQHRDFGSATTVWSAVASAWKELIDLEASLARQAEAMSRGEASEQQLAAYARDLERFEHGGGYRYASLVDEVLAGLGFDPVAARSQRLAHLSGGERGRVALARQLVIPADLLLLDEPTNHLDLATARWLESYLTATRETQLVISHDRAFLERVVDHVLHVEDGTAVPYAGGYSSFVSQRAERRLARQRAWEGQRRMIEKEEDYIRRNIAGQNTRQAKGRRKRLERLPRLSPPPGEEGTMAVKFEIGERGGDQVAVLEDVALRAGGEGERGEGGGGRGRTLFEGFTGWIRKGDVVGLVGANGSGKSTLIRALAGSLQPAAGVLRTGGGVTLSVYTQDFSDVPRDVTLFDAIALLRPMWDRGQVMKHLGRFRFRGDEVLRRTSSLSGGELARLAIARMMLGRSNFLVFDEPTNHLDVESIEELEDALEAFEGTVLLVSHDRELLRKLVSRIWSIDEGTVTAFDGGFEEWEERQASRTVPAAEPERPGTSSVPRDRPARPERSIRKLEQQVAREEEAIASIEASIQVMTDQLADSALYESPGARETALTLSTELAMARARLEEVMQRWEVLSAELEAAKR